MQLKPPLDWGELVHGFAESQPLWCEHPYMVGPIPSSFPEPEFSNAHSTIVNKNKDQDQNQDQLTSTPLDTSGMGISLYKHPPAPHIEKSDKLVTHSPEFCKLSSREGSGRGGGL